MHIQNSKTFVEGHILPVTYVSEGVISNFQYALIKSFEIKFTFFTVSHKTFLTFGWFYVIINITIGQKLFVENPLKLHHINVNI